MEIGGRKAPLSVEQRPSSLPTKFSPVRDLRIETPSLILWTKLLKTPRWSSYEVLVATRAVLDVTGGWFGGCTETFDKER